MQATSSDVAIHAQYGSIAAEQNLIAGLDAYLGGDLIVDGGIVRVETPDTNLQLQATGEIWWDRDSDGSDPNAWYRWWTGGYANEVMRLTGKQGKHDLWLKGKLKSQKLDLAEVFPTTEADVPAGTIVAIDPRRAEHVRIARPGAGDVVLGVASTDPGIVLDMPGAFDGARPDLLQAADDAQHAGDRLLAQTLRQAWIEADAARRDRVAVALAGRVPVRVNLDRGPIRSGDRLGLSREPGVAARHDGTGAVIGIALEPWPVETGGPRSAPDGRIIAFVRLEPGQQSSSEHTQPQVHRFPAGQTRLKVFDAKIKPESLPVVVFGANPGSHHWIADQGKGYFVLHLARPAAREVPFRYHIEH